MKGKCNDPFRRIQEEDTEGGGGGGGVLVEWHSAVSSSFCGVDREGKGKAREREGEGRRSEKGGGKHEMSPPCHCPRGVLIQKAVIGAVDRRHFVLCIGADLKRE